jgi:putative NADH-flavin reductase
MTQIRGASNAKAKRELEWSPPIRASATGSAPHSPQYPPLEMRFTTNAQEIVMSETDTQGKGEPAAGRQQTRITVFGASGRIGGHVVRQALDAGHKVIAAVRDPARFNVSHPALEVATVPGLTDPEMLRPVLEGSDAAISAVGPRGRKDGPVASSATRGILHAMEASGVRRFVAVSAVPVGSVPEGESWVNRRIVLPFFSTLLGDMYADLAEMEDEIRRSTTEWTVVRPPRLVNKQLTGKYRTVVGGNVPRG